MESLTDEVEAGAWKYIERIDEMGGAVAAIEAGYMQEEIERAAFEWATAVDAEKKVIVGLNRYTTDSDAEPDVFPIDPKLEREQTARLQALRTKRDDAAVKAALEELRAAAHGTQNLLPPMKEALRRYATLGEVSDVLRDEFGVYEPH